MEKKSLGASFTEPWKSRNTLIRATWSFWWGRWWLSEDRLEKPWQCRITMRARARDRQYISGNRRSRLYTAPGLSSTTFLIPLSSFPDTATVRWLRVALRLSASGILMSTRVADCVHMMICPYSKEAYVLILKQDVWSLDNFFPLRRIRSLQDFWKIDIRIHTHTKGFWWYENLSFFLHIFFVLTLIQITHEPRRVRRPHSIFTP